MNKLTFIAEGIEQTDGIKMSDILRKKLGFSTTLVAKVKFGGVFLNGENVHMRAPVRNGDTVEVYLPEESSENIPPISIPISVIYEDDHVLCVDKPKNMPTHPSRGNSLPTLANAVSAYLGVPFVFRAINRLDRDTSGIVLIAKNAYSAIKLYKKMKERGFEKQYIARVVGVPSMSHGFIDAPIAREKEGAIKRVIREDGKSAVTEYEIYRTLADGTSLLKITLHTGRTHQIRVHLSHIGHPLVDDFLYGERTGLDDYYLRCVRLGDYSVDMATPFDMLI